MFTEWISKWMKLFQVALCLKTKIYFYLSRFSKQNSIAGWNIKFRPELLSIAKNSGVFTQFSFQIYASPLQDVLHKTRQSAEGNAFRYRWWMAVIPGGWQRSLSGPNEVHLTSTDMLLTTCCLWAGSTFCKNNYQNTGNIVIGK